MRVAGFGFRTSATVAALRDALERAGGPDGIEVLATVSDKAGAAALSDLATQLGLPIRPVTGGELAAADVVHRSARVKALHGTDSVAEAAALAAAGPGARLVVARVVSADRTATAAIAEGAGS